MSAVLPNGTSATFPITTRSGMATSLVAQSGDQQTGDAGMRLLNAIGALATDRYGNPVDTLVAFTVTSGGGSVSPTSARAGLSGVAFTTWTLGSTVGDVMRHRGSAPGAAQGS